LRWRRPEHCKKFRILLPNAAEGHLTEPFRCELFGETDRLFVTEDLPIDAVLPKDTFDIAVDYSLKHWVALTDSTKAGRLEASNNFAERSKRSVAVRRIAFLFVAREIRLRSNTRWSRPARPTK
jgi:hypothetical protein